MRSDDGGLLRHQILNAVLGAAVFVGGFYLVSQEQGWLAELSKDVLGDAVFACLVYLAITQWLFRDELANRKAFVAAIVKGATGRLAVPVVETHHTLAGVDYPKWFKDATEVDVVGRANPGWLITHSESLRPRLRDGAKLRVFMPAPDDDLALEVLRSQRATPMSPEEARSTTTQVAQRLKEWTKDVKKKGKVELYHTGHSMSLSWVRVKSRREEHAIVFPYPNADSGYAPQIDIIDLKADSARMMKQYLESEIAAFMQNGAVDLSK